MISRNIELKARLRHVETAREIAEMVATERLATEEQLDTYFHCREGRLKLRQVNGKLAQLIWYARQNDTSPKPSDYQLVPVADAESLKAALTSALGVRSIIRKRRQIFLWGNVRIHLDEVEGSGHFLEFEAVLGPGIDDKAGHAQLIDLVKRFEVQDDDLLAGSYSELVE